MSSGIYQATVQVPTSYPTNPQVTIPFVPDRIHLILDDSGNSKYADISFDGTTNHAHLHTDNSVLRHDLELDQTQIWLKGTNSCQVRVVATWHDEA